MPFNKFYWVFHKYLMSNHDPSVKHHLDSMVLLVFVVEPEIVAWLYLKRSASYLNLFLEIEQEVNLFVRFTTNGMTSIFRL